MIKNFRSQKLNHLINAFIKLENEKRSCQYTLIKKLQGR